MTNGTNYQPPVDRLLSFGECYGTKNQWHDYIVELGFNSQHIPDLMRMAVDDTLNGADSASQKVWAPIHAWRALAQLGAKEAVEPLMKLFHRWEDNDWVAEEMPKIYGAISQGLEAGHIATSTPSGNITNFVISAIQNYLAEESHGVFPRITSVNCLEEIGKQSKNERSQCIDVLTKQLKLFAQNPTELNGFIVASLIELQAIESASIIYSAFFTEAVPEDIVGSWDDVQQILGVNADDLQLILDVPAESEVIDNVGETVIQTSDDDVTPTLLTDTTPTVADVPAESEVIDDVGETITQTSDGNVIQTLPTDTTPTVADVPAESEVIDNVGETVIQTSDDDVTPTLLTDTTPTVADAPAESEVIDNVGETVTQTSNDDVTPTLPTDTTPTVADVPAESEVIDDVGETVTQTSDDDVTPNLPTDTTPTVADAPAESEHKNQATIAESPVAKSSTQKAEIEENKGFGTNIAKKKSKTSKKKKR